MKQVNKQINLSMKIQSYSFYVNSQNFIRKYILIIFKKPKNIKINIKFKSVKISEMYITNKIMMTTNKVNVLKYK